MQYMLTEEEYDNLKANREKVEREILDRAQALANTKVADWKVSIIKQLSDKGLLQNNFSPYVTKQVYQISSIIADTPI